MIASTRTQWWRSLTKLYKYLCYATIWVVVCNHLSGWVQPSEGLSATIWVVVCNHLSGWVEELQAALRFGAQQLEICGNYRAFLKQTVFAGEVYILSTTVARSRSPSGHIYQLIDPAKRGNPEKCRKTIIPVVTVPPPTSSTILGEIVDVHDFCGFRFIFHCSSPVV